MEKGQLQSGMSNVMTTGTHPQKRQFLLWPTQLFVGREGSEVRDSSPFAFGQFQNVIYIGVFPLDQPTHRGVDSKEG